MAPSWDMQAVGRAATFNHLACRGRLSFRNISACADKLECELGDCDESSAESIASFLLKKKQEDIEACLREQQQRLHRVGFGRSIDLLRFAAYCSWRASLLCGSLYKSIRNARRAITRIQRILDTPAGHSQVDALILALADLRKKLFSDEDFERIRQGNSLLCDLESEFKEYQGRTVVRTLSGLSKGKRRAKHGMARCKHVMGHLKAKVRNKLMVFSSNEEEDDNNGIVAGHDAYVLGQGNVVKSLHKVHGSLHKIETSMKAISRTFDHLPYVLEKAHHRNLISQDILDCLRGGDPLMLANDVAPELASLGSHLEFLWELVLECFCRINSARELACHV